MYKKNAPYSASLDLLVGVYDTHLWTIFVWKDFLFRVFLFNINCDIKISSFFLRQDVSYGFIWAHVTYKPG